MRAPHDPITTPIESAGTRQRALCGVLVTYKRPAQLRNALELLGRQVVRPQPVVVVDNAPSDATREVVAAARLGGTLDVVHLEMPDNLGPAGALSRGIAHLLPSRGSDDWVLVLNDDFRHEDSTILGEILRFAEERRATDDRTGLVGLCGSRFDPRRGRVHRVPSEELQGPVRVNSVGGGHLGMYRVAALRDTGPFFENLFFGFEELELGTRLSRNGWTLYAHGALWRRYRLNRAAGPSMVLSGTLWRRYYTLRNMIWLLRRHHHPEGALRVSVIHVLKPLLAAPTDPSVAFRHLHNNVQAIAHGWSNHLGRTVEPSGYC